MNNKKKYFTILIIFLVGLVCGLVIGQNLNKKNVVQPLSTGNNQTNINTRIKSDDQLFPRLDLPMEYFSIKDVRGGSAGKGIGDKITDYTSAFLNNKTVYQSYPTTVITIKDYSNEHKPIPSSQSAQGDFSVDGDNSKEEILSLSAKDANHPPQEAEIVRGNEIIFSAAIGGTIAMQPYIIEAENHNGFYLDWVSWDQVKDGECCATGYMRTRFIYAYNKFTPVYEQEVRYLKIGKE